MFDKYYDELFDLYVQLMYIWGLYLLVEIAYKNVST